MSPRAWTRRESAGFTILELMVTIALTAILAVGLAGLLRHPFAAREAVSRRADLVELGDIALTRIVRDLERAVPKSVRVTGGGAALEFMPATHVGPYRSAEGVNDPGGPNEQDHTADDDRLDFAADESFNVLGRLANRPAAYGATLAVGTRVVVGPTSPAVLWADAAGNRDPGSISRFSTRLSMVDDGDEDQVRLSAAHTFSASSGSRRFYLTSAPVSWVWDGGDRSLWRVADYGTHAAQPADRGVTPLSAGRSALATPDVERCVFSYDPGPSTRGGVVTIELVLERSGERVRLFEQVEVRHAP